MKLILNMLLCLTPVLSFAFDSDKGNGGGPAQMNFAVFKNEMVKQITAPENAAIFSNIQGSKLIEYISKERTVKVVPRESASQRSISEVPQDTQFIDESNIVELTTHWEGGYSRLNFQKIQLFANLAQKFKSPNPSMSLPELVGVMNGSVVAEDGIRYRKNAVKIVSILAEALKKDAAMLGIDVNHFSRIDSISHFSVYSTTVDRLNYLKTGVLKDKFDNEVSYKKVGNHIIMNREAIKEASECLGYNFKSDRASCAAELSLFFHEMLRLANYDDDNYQISSVATPLILEFLNSEPRDLSKLIEIH